MADGRHNMKNPAVKRILQEVKEMQNNPSDDYMSLPLEDNIFEWQFAIRGPKDSEFEGGIYHGRIQLPPEYPFKPPSFMLLTPNGRFETQTKICLSISQYHPEHWQPSWSVRTALVALIAFMPTKPDGAIGSLDYTKEERRALAIKSRGEAPKFGNEERQKLIDEVHSYMVQKSPPVPELPVGNADTTSDSTSQGALQKVEKCPSVEELVADNVQGPENSSIMDGDHDEAVQNTFEVPVNADAGSVVVDHVDRQATDVASNRIILPAQMTPNPQTPARTGGIQQQADDRGLTLLAVGLTMALIALLVKKFMKSYWWFDAGSI